MLSYDTFRKPGLRVAVMTPGLQPGGAEMWLSTLYRHAKTVKYKCLITGSPPDEELSEMFGGLSIRAVPERTIDSLVNSTREAITANGGVDLVMYWGFQPMHGLLSLGVPIVHVSHSSGAETGTDWHQQNMARHGMSQANFLSAVSGSAALFFSSELRKREDVTVIHNGSDVERTRPTMGRAEQRKRWGITEESKVILYVGRFSPEKGCDIALECLEHLPGEWHLILYGWGALENDLKKRARNLLQPSGTQSKARVFFPKPRTSGLGDVYAAADLVVIPSVTEAFPLVLIEAWQAGVPVICSEFQTILEIEEQYAEKRQLAWHVGCPPSSEELAKAVLEVDQDDKRVEEAAEIAFSYFTAAAMVHRWEEYFYRCVAEWQYIGRNGIIEISPTKTPA